MTRRLLPRALVALGVVLAAIALLAIYVRTTVFDDNEARSLARALAAQPVIRAQVATTSVDQLYSNVNVAATIRRRLPAAQRGVAGPLAAGLRTAATQGVERLLAEPAVQRTWVDAVYRAHRQLVAVFENRQQGVTVANGRAVLDLRPLVVRAGERVGLGANVADLLPPSAGRITIFRSSDLRSAQWAARVLNAVANWFWVLALASWAGALWLVRGARRRVLRGIAGGLVLAGIALLALRAIVGHYAVDALVSAQGARPAASTAWAVMTARLADSAWTTLAVGAIGLLWLWLLGSPHARRVRSALAPVVAPPEVAYGGLAVLVGLLVWWGPTIEAREWRGILLIAAGAVLAVELLRRATVREFPEARLDEVWAALRTAPAPPPALDEVSRLERLARLHETGALTDGEFAAAKRLVLDAGEHASL